MGFAVREPLRRLENGEVVPLAGFTALRPAPDRGLPRRCPPRDESKERVPEAIRPDEDGPVVPGGVNRRVAGLLVEGRPVPISPADLPAEEVDDVDPLIRRRPAGRCVERAIDRPEDRGDPRPIVGRRAAPRRLPPLPMFLDERELPRLARDAGRRDEERDRPALDRDRPPREPRDAEGFDRLRDGLLAECDLLLLDDLAADRDPPALDERAAECEEPRPLGGPLCTSVAATAAKNTARTTDSFRPKARLGLITFLPFQFVQSFRIMKDRHRE